MLKVMQDEIISHELSSWKSQDFEEVWMTKAAHLLVINKQKCNVEVDFEKDLNSRVEKLPKRR